MNDLPLQYFDEAIRLEHLATKLYLLFNRRFPEDAEFWWRIALEEKKHAAMLENGKLYFINTGCFPAEITTGIIDVLIAANRDYEELLTDLTTDEFDRTNAFQEAIRLEESAGEIHLQKVMNDGNDTELHRIFRRLHNDDLDHSSRIRQYMAKKGYSLSGRD